MMRLISAASDRLNRILASLDRRPGRDPFVDMKSLLSSTRKPCVIFDVGAHHGQTTLRFRRLFPDSTIYAFEPFDESFTILKANTLRDPKVISLHLGLADSPGYRLFNSNTSSATNSLLATSQSAAQIWGSGLLDTHRVVEARFDVLDSVMDLHKVSAIDILKIDVQGSEQLVMKGALRACAKRRIYLVYTEIIVQPTYDGQLRFDRALSCFYDNGFDLYGIYEMCRSARGPLAQLDALFVRSG